jgi:N-acetylmuramoyl-L-alanine amidase
MAARNIIKSLDFGEKEKGEYTVNTDSLNIRRRPTVESPIVGKLKRGEVFVLNGTEEKDDGLWLRMDKGYVFAIYTRNMTKRINSKSINFAGKEKRQYIVYADSLNIRSRPTVESPIVGKLIRGQVFVLNGTEEKDDVLWLKMERGYVAAKYTVELHLGQ